MDNTYISILIFVIITVAYYMFPAFGKIPMTLDVLESNDLASYYKKNIPRLGFYFLLVIVSQFAFNAIYLINKCGGNSSSNIGAAAAMTFFPWVLIFGVMMAVLMMYPGLKTAFSDVVGYFVVAGKANEILSSILIDTDVNSTIESADDMNPVQKGNMKKSAEAILKLFGNKSILINKMSPENFLGVWNIIKPLFKQNIENIDNKQAELLKLVVLKDNIGEGLWYLYTAILLISIVSYNLATRGCQKNAEQLKASHEEYVKQEEAVKAQQDLNNSTTVVLTS